MDEIFDKVLEYETLDVEEEDLCVRFRLIPRSNQNKTEDRTSHSRFEVDDIWDGVYEEDDVNIKDEPDGTFSLELKVPKMLHGSIIGFKGAVKRKLELETDVKIFVPSKTDLDGSVIITGHTPSALIKCKQRIDIILLDARMKQPFTHFISIPMTSENIRNNFLKFKDEVLRLGQLRGVNETIFQNPYKLHLTIGTLVLASNEEILEASNLLLKLKLEITDPIIENFGPLNIRMKGLEYMNDDPSEVDVLYGKVEIENDDNFLLQRISDELIEYFVDAGIMFKKYDRVKLHVTLMNTLFRKDKDGAKINMENDYDKELHRERETFDAQKILETFEDYDFGIQEFRELHISIRKSTAVKSGYYKPAYVQKLLQEK